MRSGRCTTLARVGVAGLALAAGSVATAACEAPEHRQFDFWIGTWDVHAADGRPAGVNRIERGYGGCVLHERYTTEPRPYRGESLNAYDATRQLWHQTWVDNTGLVLRLEGGLREGRMVLEGDGRDAEGRPVRHRITWSPLPDGRVRQHWQSTDAQGDERTVFDGLYSRR